MRRLSREMSVLLSKLGTKTGRRKLGGTSSLWEEKDPEKTPGPLLAMTLNCFSLRGDFRKVG